MVVAYFAANRGTIGWRKVEVATKMQICMCLKGDDMRLLAIGLGLAFGRCLGGSSPGNPF